MLAALGRRMVELNGEAASSNQDWRLHCMTLEQPLMQKFELQSMKSWLHTTSCTTARGSPLYQRAFGTLDRLPSRLFSDDQIEKQLILEGGGDATQRPGQIREAASKAWLPWQDDEAVR